MSNLAATWESIVDQFPERVGSIPVEMRVSPEALDRLRRFLRDWARLTPVQKTDRDGWVHVRGEFPHAAGAAANLVSFGGQVEVLSPPDVRDELARLSRELTELYA